MPESTNPPIAAGSDAGIEVVPVSEEDWEVWRDIRLRSLRDSPDAFGSTLERELAFTEQDWRRRLDGSGPAVLARSGGAAVGMGAGFIHAPGKLMIVAMWTDPGHRGRGVGSRILDALVAWAERNDVRPDLWVADTNPAARALYERHGFVATGETAPLRDGSPISMSRLALPPEP
jgi:GNAT superfamily N-acetyltransferase